MKVHPFRHLGLKVLAIALATLLWVTVPVVPATQGEPAPGFVAGRVSAEPATVDIVGPDTRVRQIAEATTEPVSIAGARSRVRDVVTVGVVDSSVRLLQPQSATVIVEV